VSASKNAPKAKYCVVNDFIHAFPPNGCAFSGGAQACCNGYAADRRSSRQKTLSPQDAVNLFEG
jgi:hypothetical protein